MKVSLRRPRPDEAAALSALCLRSKASHGYDDDFMDACRDELAVRLPASNDGMIVAVVDGRLAGMAELSMSGTDAELEKLFVEPDFFRRGVGKALFGHIAEAAAARGACRLGLDADPGAVAFYRSMGAVETGSSESASIPGRYLPRMELALDAVSSG